MLCVACRKRSAQHDSEAVVCGDARSKQRRAA